MTAPNTVKPSLGKIAYVVNQDGSLSRSFVSLLTKDGYEVFNTGNLGKYSFNFFEAAEMSVDILLERKKTLESEIEKIILVLRDNASLDHQAAVDASTMKYPHTATGFLAGKEMSMPPAPARHIMPGELGYVIVTPMIATFLFNDSYKALPYSIVEVEVQAAILSAGGLVYETDIFSRAFPATTFADLPAAKEKLAELYSGIIGRTLPPEQMVVVSHAEMLAQKATPAGLQPSPAAYLTNELDSSAFLGD